MGEEQRALEGVRMALVAERIGLNRRMVDAVRVEIARNGGGGSVVTGA